MNQYSMPSGYPFNVLFKHTHSFISFSKRSNPPQPTISMKSLTNAPQSSKLILKGLGIPGRQLASVMTGAFCYLEEALQPPSLRLSHTIRVKLLLHHIKCPVLLFWPNHRQPNRPSNQICQLQPCGIALFIRKHNLKR